MHVRWGFVVHKLLKKYTDDGRPVAAKNVETLMCTQDASIVGPIHLATHL